MALFINDGTPNPRDELRKRLREEQWAELIRLKEELILHPFTPEIVKRAIHHFGREHRPWMPYAHDDYHTILVAEPEDRGYGLYNPEEDWENLVIPGTWREWAAELGQSMDEFADEWDLEEDQYDNEFDPDHYIERLPHSAGPQGSAYSILDSAIGVHEGEFPIGCVYLIAGDSPMHDLHYAVVRPKMALTFVQIYLDWQETGIKIVLEDEWMKMKAQSDVQ